MNSQSDVTYRNPFAIGAFRPVERECAAKDLPVEGELPPELDGLFVRNSFVPLPGKPLPPHLFFADGMAHGLRLENGRARWFRSRWVVTEGVAQARNQPPPAGPADIRWAPINPANTHLLHHGGRLLALCEVGLPYELTPDLETVGRYDFGGRLKTNMTSHPRIDPETGWMHFFAYGPRPPFAHFYSADSNGTLVRSQPVDVQSPAVMHDFVLSKRYAIFFETPLVFAPPSGPPAGLPFTWAEGRPARIGLLPLDPTAGPTRWFDIEPCYVLHFMNAFDQDKSVVIHGVARDIGYALGQKAPNEGFIALQEWRIDLDSGKVSSTILSERRVDFPRTDERRAGRPYRYGYGVEIPGDAHWASHGNLYKFDLERGSVEEHDFGMRAKASEPVFVPKNAAAGEDEGWVLSCVYDDAADASFVAILDARNFAAPPVAIVRLPQRVPYGAHGSWIEASQLG